MERGRKVKQTLDSIFFVTPEQRLMRFLLSESTTDFTTRVLSSKLKGVRGLGGVEGIQQIVANLAELGLVQAVDNNRKICLHNDHIAVRMMKTFAAICDLEDLKVMMEPVSSKGVLFGSRATGLSSSDSDYNVFVISDNPSEVERIAGQHPQGKRISVVVWSPNDYLTLSDKNPQLAEQVNRGFVLWGNSW